MKNADKSAYPVADTVSNGQRFEPLVLGLTKREHFACLAMQGILANPSFYNMSIEESTKLAIKQADELLKQLDN